MVNFVLGLCLICLGIAGVVKNWYAVLDTVSVLIPLLLLFVGVLAFSAGVNGKAKD